MSLKTFFRKRSNEYIEVEGLYTDFPAGLADAAEVTTATWADK
jgi:hypothetical protein